MSEARRIGGDWVENTDPGSGKKYYANVVTQETRWTWPDEIAKEEGEGEDDWEERSDPASGKTYYVNRKTQQTQWTKPGASATWIENEDPASGKKYYINSETNETTWEKPAGFDDGKAEPAKAEAKAAAVVKVEPEAEPEAVIGYPAIRNTNNDFKPAKAEPAKKPAKDDKFAKLRGLKKGKSEAKNSSKKEGKKEDAKSVALQGGGHALGKVDQAKMKALETVEIGDIEVAKMEDWAKPIEQAGRGKFNLDRKGMFGKRTKVEKILRFKKDLIKTALLKLNSSMNVEAVQAFKNVVSFMGDRTTRKDAGGHAQKLMKNTL